MRPQSRERAGVSRAGGEGQGAQGTRPRGQPAAAVGSGAAFSQHSQVKYQVVVALFGDAVVEPHCGRDRGVTARPAPARAHPPGPSREGQSRDALPPPALLPLAVSWGGSRSAKCPRGASLKGHVQIGDSGDLAQLPGRLRPRAPGLRIRRGAGLPSPGINLAFYLFFPSWSRPSSSPCEGCLWGCPGTTLCPVPLPGSSPCSVGCRVRAQPLGLNSGNLG